jgi:hypothetical protein
MISEGIPWPAGLQPARMVPSLLKTSNRPASVPTTISWGPPLLSRSTTNALP